MPEDDAGAPEPSACAACTYSEVRSPNTTARVMRTYAGICVIEMAMSAFVRLGPSVATMAIASKMPGKASRMSTSQTTTVSSQPPTYPARSPKSTPMTAAMPTAMSPTRKLMRPPCQTRTNRSRPFSSAPKGSDQRVIS